MNFFNKFIRKFDKDTFQNFSKSSSAKIQPPEENLTSNKNYLVRILSVVIFAIGLASIILLLQLLSQMKSVFLTINNTFAHTYIESYELRGINLSLSGRIIVHSNLPNKIELIQVRIFSEDGAYLGSWSGEPIDNNGRFFIKFSNRTLFNMSSSGSLPNGSSVLILDGFAKLSLDIGGPSKLKINLPIRAEVSLSEEKK
ncbi:MAG: hypothetical protein ACK40U_09270 [Fervidobacterium pennivorans]